jgi:hypothetical protein
MGLEEDITNALSEKISATIDWSIFSDYMVTSGWTRIKIKPIKNAADCLSIQGWLEDNCVDSVKSQNWEFIFKNNKDAMLFVLRWG